MNIEGLWRGAYGLSSLSEKTIVSNHLQMSLQRQHFLLSCLKTLCRPPARPPARHPGAQPNEQPVRGKGNAECLPNFVAFTGWNLRSSHQKWKNLVWYLLISCLLARDIEQPLKRES